MTSFILIAVAIVTAVSICLVLAVRKQGASILPILLALAVVYPLVAWIYWSIGSPQHLEKTQVAQETQVKHDEILKNIAKLEQELKQNPGDTQKLTQLAYSYLYTEQFDKSAFMFQILSKTQPNNTDLLVQTADAIAMAAGGNVTSNAQQYLDQALEINPYHQQALWMSGLGATQRQDNANALLHWTRLLSTLEKEEDKVQLSQMMSQLNVDIEPSDNNTSETQETGQNTVQVEVSVAEGINLDEDRIVFVFAKASSGPPAPLAVKRLSLKSLPATVVLSDTDAMMPGHQISSYDKIKVVAKVTKDGSAVGETLFISEEVDISLPIKQAVKLTLH